MIARTNPTTPMVAGKAQRIELSGAGGIRPEKKDYGYRFTKVKDARGREVDGLWERNGRFYYQISVPGKNCSKIPLKDELGNPVETVAQAVTAKHELRRTKRVGEFVAPKRAPSLADFVAHYVSWLQQINKKSWKTVQQEKSALKGWVKFMGELRLSQITKQHINSYMLERKQQQSDICNRTLNLDVLILSNCLKFAREEGYFHHRLPTEGWKRFEYRAPKRELVTKEQIDRLCAVALEKQADGAPRFRNGELFVDYIRFMQYSGARKTSALATLWEDVSFERRQVHLRKTKYDKKDVVVDFNPELEALLKDVHARRLPDSESMFPSPRNDGAGGSLTSLQKTLEEVRNAAGLPNFTFHLLRHYFISWCVMSGVDILTIARWVGHGDGGLLIGKVYSHLSSEHTQAAGKKVIFGLTAASREEGESATMVDLAKISAADLIQMFQQLQSNREQRPQVDTGRGGSTNS
jgi:integrase